MDIKELLTKLNGTGISSSAVDRNGIVHYVPEIHRHSEMIRNNPAIENMLRLSQFTEAGIAPSIGIKMNSTPSAMQGALLRSLPEKGNYVADVEGKMLMGDKATILKNLTKHLGPFALAMAVLGTAPVQAGMMVNDLAGEAGNETSNDYDEEFMKKTYGNKLADLLKQKGEGI